MRVCRICFNTNSPSRQPVIIYASHPPFRVTTVLPEVLGETTGGVTEGHIDLYLADARTGEVESKITETALDPHIDSLQFVNSAGDWTRDGKRFAFGSIRDGRPEISIFDVETRKIERHFPLSMLGEIYNVTWSPNGLSLAFSAMSGGVTDLFLLELSSGNVRGLTNDLFADLQPAWSPDGTQIAFVTDRFTSDLSNLSFGPYSLALLNPSDGQITRLAAFNAASHINPQWSPDNESVYFTSDVSGIPNIYRVVRESGMVYQITNLQTGVSGITSLSPAMSTASGDGAIVFSSFAEGMYSLRRLDSPQEIAGNPATVAPPGVAASILPPRGRTSGQVVGFLGDPQLGLQPTTARKRVGRGSSACCLVSRLRQVGTQTQGTANMCQMYAGRTWPRASVVDRKCAWRSRLPMQEVDGAKRY